jgi:hypothetical protein
MLCELLSVIINEINFQVTRLTTCLSARISEVGMYRSKWVPVIIGPNAAAPPRSVAKIIHIRAPSLKFSDTFLLLVLQRLHTVPSTSPRHRPI